MSNRPAAVVAVVMNTFDSCGGPYSDYSVNVSTIDKDQVWLWIFAAISFCAVPYAVAICCHGIIMVRCFRMVQDGSSIIDVCQVPVQMVQSMQSLHSTVSWPVS